MKLFVTKADDGAILVNARAESDGGDMVGDLTDRIPPGESALGKTYEEWLAIAEIGSVEIH